MKNLKKLLFVLVCISAFQMNAQIPVTDVAAEGQLTMLNSSSFQTYLKTASMLAKQIKQLKNQNKMKKTGEDTLETLEESLETLNNMKKTYDEWTDAMREIRGSIEYGKETINTANKVGEISELYVNILDYIYDQETISSESKDFYIRVFTKILNKSISLLESSKDITNEGTYEMKDGERLTFLKSIEKDSNKNYTLMVYAYKKLVTSVNRAKTIDRQNAFFNGNNQQNNNPIRF